MRPRSAILITHTHWDREWYLSVDEYRFRLVKCLDALLEILREEPDYHSFWLDGQTLALDDYLEVRPEKKEEILAALRAGKLLIGPWYGEMDEFMPSGESLVRNLAMGVRRMREFGQENLVGYLADNFGQTSQMPQILLGFGIANAVFWRGFRLEELAAAEEAWVGADGSTVAAVCLVAGYGALTNLPAITGSKDRTDGEARRCSEAVKTLKKYFRGPILLMNGVDHSLPVRNVGAHIRRLEKLYPELRVRHGSLVEYMAHLRTMKLPKKRLRGELHDGLGGLESIGSARVEQKLDHARVEDLLVHYAEPLDALAACAARGMTPAGRGAPPGFLRRAWQLLMKNQIHDSLSGAHVDSAAQDVLTRYRRAEAIAMGVIREALNTLTGQEASTKPVAAPISVWLCQPCGWRRKSVVELELELPPDSPFERITLARNGKEYPCEMLSCREADRILFQPHANPTFQKVRRVRVLCAPGGLSSVSMTRFDVRTDSRRAETAPSAGRPVSESPALDNGIVRAEIHKDATLDLTDMRSGLTVRGSNLLQDEPDLGNLYQSAQRVGAAPVRPDFGTVERVHCGRLRAAYQVRTSIRSGGASLPLNVTLMLNRGEDYVRIRTEIDNRAGSHRLRALFPAPAGMPRVWAHAPFDVVERKPAVAANRPFHQGGKDAVYECNETTKPMQMFVAVTGSAGALFVLSRGLYEYAMPRQGPMAVTLLRGSDYVYHCFRMYEASGGQCLGKYALEYAVGLSARPSPATLLKRAMEFRLAPLACQVSGRGLPQRSIGICSVSRPDWIISSVTCPEEGNGLVVRLFSLSRTAQRGALTIGAPLGHAHLLRLDGQRLRRLAVKNRTVSLRLAPRQIATVLFE